jgi:hypothetical protein
MFWTRTGHVHIIPVKRHFYAREKDCTPMCICRLVMVVAHCETLQYYYYYHEYMLTLFSVSFA